MTLLPQPRPPSSLFCRKAVSITHIPTNGGVVNPVVLIGKVMKKHPHSLYILDSCQAVGQLHVDVSEIQCDFLSATGRKFLRGPRGTGFLYARRAIMNEMDRDLAAEGSQQLRDPPPRLQEPPTLDHWAAPVCIPGLEGSYRLHPSARRFEQWESNFAGLVALGTAIEYALQIGLDNIERRIKKMSQYLQDLLHSGKHTIPGLHVTKSHCGIIVFHVRGVASLRIKSYLQEKHRIYVHTTSPLSTPLSGVNIPSSGAVRVSVSYFNTEGEMESFVRALCQCVRQCAREDELESFPAK